MEKLNQNYPQFSLEYTKEGNGYCNEPFCTKMGCPYAWGYECPMNKMKGPGREYADFPSYIRKYNSQRKWEIGFLVLAVLFLFLIVIGTYFFVRSGLADVFSL